MWASLCGSSWVCADPELCAAIAGEVGLGLCTLQQKAER